MSLQFIVATYQSATSEATSWVTPCRDKSLCVYWGIFVKILSPQHYFHHSKLHKFCQSYLILSDLLLWQILLQRQICTKILQYEAICHGKLLSQRAGANCCQVCSTFKSFGAPSRHPLTVTMYVEMLKLHEVAASTWWSWMILLRIEMRGNSADK